MFQKVGDSLNLLGEPQLIGVVDDRTRSSSGLSLHCLILLVVTVPPFPPSFGSHQAFLGCLLVEGGVDQASGVAEGSATHGFSLFCHVLTPPIGYFLSL